MKILCAILLLFIALLSGLLLTPQANGQSRDLQILTGIGVLSSEQIWQDADTLVSAVPVIQIDYGKWQFLGEGLVSYHLINEQDVTLNIGLGYREEGFGASVFSKESSSNNPVFDGYQTPDGELTGNLKIGWKNLTLAFEQDISDTSGGTVVDFAVNFPLVDTSFGLNISATASASWISKEYAHHLYGIEGAQINLDKGRAAFQSDALTNYSFAIHAEYVLTENWILNASADYAELDDNILDSSLVSDSKVSQFLAAAFYVF